MRRQNSAYRNGCQVRFVRRVNRLAPRLLGALRRCCESFPYPRRGSNGTCRIADIGMAAFPVFFMQLFFMQSPSFLAHQRRMREGHGRSNCASLFGLEKIPGDNHMRAMLDPAAPALLDPVFAEVLTELERSGGPAGFRRLGEHVLIALDGSEYFCSGQFPQCSTRRRSNGKVECYHAMLGATLVAPGHNHVVPLAPEFIVPQDGSDKQDCESRAARRWLAAHGAQYARLRPVYLGDDLFANQPMCEAVKAAGGNFVFTCKPASHALIGEYITGVELPTHSVRVKRGREWVTHRFRWLAEVPLRDGRDALKVNWFEIEISNAGGDVTYRNSFITDLPVGRDTVADLAACGRARWKIENETFNVLKNNGYDLEHSFGHGKR